MVKLKATIEVGGVHDVDEAAQLIGVGVATVWRWIRSGKIAAVYIEGRTLIPETEVKRLKNEKGSGQVIEDKMNEGQGNFGS